MYALYIVLISFWHSFLANFLFSNVRVEFLHLYSIINCQTFYRKDSQELGTSYKKGIPIEVIPMAYKPVQMKIQDMFGGEAVLRMAQQKAVSVQV